MTIKYSTYITECEECGCIISYDIRQVVDGMIDCPCCHTKSVHSNRLAKYEKDEINNILEEE